MTRQTDKKVKIDTPDVWIAVKLNDKSSNQLPQVSSNPVVEVERVVECNPSVQRSILATQSTSNKTNHQLQETKASKNLLTFFTTSKLMSKTSVTLGGSSPYATISRRKTSKPSIDVVDYYESCCEENDSVSSLPLPKTTRSFQTDYKKCSSMPRLFTLPSSIAGDSLPSIFEEDRFAFLDQYETRDYPEYFLPLRRETKAYKQWAALESSGDYEKLDTTNDYCARPLCLIIGDERMPSTWLNVYPDLLSWF